jgi:hypothetical protein
LESKKVELIDTNSIKVDTRGRNGRGREREKSFVCGQHGTVK